MLGVHIMATSFCILLNLNSPLNEGHGLIGHGGMEVFVPMLPTANPAHTSMDIWGTRLEHTGISSEEPDLTDGPTPAEVQKTLEAQAGADAEESAEQQIQHNGVRMGSLLPYATYDEYLEAAECANSCPVSEYSFLEAKAGTASHFATYKDYLAWAAEINAKCEGGQFETIRPISEALFRESQELANELKDRDAFEEVMKSIGITVGANNAYMEWCEAKNVYQYDLETFQRWCELMEEPTDEQIQEARAIQQDEDAARSDEIDWVTVENGDGSTRQVAWTQCEEDLAAGLLVDVGGCLIYKSDMHRAAEESDEDYVLRLEANIRRVEAEIAAERTPVVHAARPSAPDADIDYFANLATRDDVRE